MIFLSLPDVSRLLESYRDTEGFMMPRPHGQPIDTAAKLKGLATDSDNSRVQDNLSLPSPATQTFLAPNPAMK